MLFREMERLTFAKHQNDKHHDTSRVDPDTQFLLKLPPQYRTKMFLERLEDNKLFVKRLQYMLGLDYQDPSFNYLWKRRPDLLALKGSFVNGKLEDVKEEEEPPVYKDIKAGDRKAIAARVMKSL